VLSPRPYHPACFGTVPFDRLHVPLGYLLLDTLFESPAQHTLRPPRPGWPQGLITSLDVRQGTGTRVWTRAFLQDEEPPKAGGGGRWMEWSGFLPARQSATPFPASGPLTMFAPFKSSTLSLCQKLDPLSAKRVLRGMAGRDRARLVHCPGRFLPLFRRHVAALYPRVLEAVNATDFVQGRPMAYCLQQTAYKYVCILGNLGGDQSILPAVVPQ